MEVDAPPDDAALEPLATSKRYKNTLNLLENTAERVVSSLTESRFKKCFPEYQDRYPELMKTLKARFEDIYREGITRAIEISMDAFDFLRLVAAFDAIVSDATSRRTRGEAPRLLYLRGADAAITVPNATAPALRVASAQLRARRLELEARNQATYAALAQDQAVVDRTDRQVRDILAEFHRSVEILEAVDGDRLAGLQARMVDALPDA